MQQNRLATQCLFNDGLTSGMANYSNRLLVLLRFAFVYDSVVLPERDNFITRQSLFIGAPMTIIIVEVGAAACTYFSM